MDQDWPVEDWDPSDPTMTIGPRKTSESEVEEFQLALINATEKIKETPYLFLPWTDRAFNLTQLGYPELAAADAYKVIMLCNAGLDSLDALGDIVRFSTAMYLILVQKKLHIGVDKLYLCLAVEKVLQLMRGKAYLILSAIVLKLRAFPDVLRICSEALELYTTDTELSPAEAGIQQRLLERFYEARSEFDKCATYYASERLPFETQKQLLSFGFNYIRTYPWVPIDKRVRSFKQIETYNENLKNWSNCLKIRISMIEGSKTKVYGPICYGMFATRDIQKGEFIMTEIHPFAMSLEQPETQCMNCFTPVASATHLRMMECCPGVAYCSEDCEKSAMDNYHSTICGKDFSAIINQAHQSYGGKAESIQYGDGTTELEDLTGWEDQVTDEHKHSQYPFPDYTPVFMIRILGMCVQAGCDPLSHPKIAQLKPNVGAEMTWSFNGMVKGPIEVLQTLGVDVFANHNFDTWVILSMWYRIMNNSTSAAMEFPNRIMAPNYCWFNHSCNPNATMVLPRSGLFSVTELVALRDIREDEEVFVSYISPEELLTTKENRQMKLESWLRSPCNCSRCRKE